MEVRQRVSSRLLWSSFSRYHVFLFGFAMLFSAGTAEACWGKMAPKYGDMTRDYDLLVGDELVLNCTLNSHEIEVDKKKYYANSSQLTFRKGSRFPPEFVRVVDALTAQLRLPNATKTDSGMYVCEVNIPEPKDPPVVCISKVNVGYPPGPVTNFRCESRFYENLTCSWDVPDSAIQTRYRLYKQFYLSRFWESPQLQPCPETVNDTYCQWREDTDPPFDVKEEVLKFEVRGNNSLGFYSETFSLKHYEIFVPNRPQSLTAVDVNKRNVTLKWSVPAKMDRMKGKPPLHYEVLVEEMNEDMPSRQLFDAGIDTSSYVVSGLIPYITYNFSVRCRSEFANGPTSWSPVISVQRTTLPDVPYKVPETIPEAYELRNYGEDRTLTLYWKPIERKHFNGEEFKYYVEYNRSFSENDVPSVKYTAVRTLTATFTSLHVNQSYSFRLFSSNKEGLSAAYRTIFLDRQENLPKLPSDITVISHNPGRYELSWKPPAMKNRSVTVDYVVFWCSSVKPWQSRCDGPIQWLDIYLTEPKVTLNLSDSATNFQFAVAARAASASSGMQWASCIVPYKAALSKIRSVFLEPKTSSSVKVMWKLQCDAQMEVVGKYEIVYCKTDHNRHCQGEKVSVYVTDPKSQSYILQNLQPFSNYSVVVRAYNLDGFHSEDSDPKYQTTMQGAPADPPGDVEVFAMPNATLRVTWRPPVQPNGVITHYRLTYGSITKEIEVNSTSEVYETNMKGLLHFVNYSITLAACVGHYCSPASLPVIAQTDIGTPGYIGPPRLEPINSTFIRVLWDKPLMPNGPIDFYEVYWKEVSNWTSTEAGMKIVEDGLSTVVEIKCSSIKDGGIKYLFSVRAANRKDGNVLYGPLSADSQTSACFLSQGTAMVIGAAIGGTLLLAVIMLVIYKIIKWMSDKIHQVKNITVRLPKGLDGLENNPLNNYGEFKNGLINHTVSSPGVNRLSYVIDDGDNKNRHGSGSSQYSYSSTDELLYRSGKCTRFSRKPSAESSGCSSLSSNFTKLHPSSESSTESEFMTPPSPDMVFADQAGHKSTLPVVVEAQDSVDEGFRKTASQEDDGNTDIAKESHNVDPRTFKDEQPYSKLGMPGLTKSSPPSWRNSLAFYSRNLSSSEPSVMDTKQLAALCAPYSKVGLAKSSGDIIGLRTDGLEAGYSRFGILPKLDGGDPNLRANPRNSEFLPNTDLMNGVIILPSKLTFNGIPNTENPKNHKWSHDVNDAAIKSANSFQYDSATERGYVKAREPERNTAIKSGYVPFSEMKSMGHSSPLSYPLVHYPPSRDENSGYPKSESEDEEEHEPEFHATEFPVQNEKVFNNEGIQPVPEEMCQAGGIMPSDLSGNGYLTRLLDQNGWSGETGSTVPSSTPDGVSKDCEESGVSSEKCNQLLLDDSQGTCADPDYHKSNAGIENCGYFDNKDFDATAEAYNLPSVAGKGSTAILQQNSSPPEEKNQSVLRNHISDSRTSGKNGYIPLSCLSGLTADAGPLAASHPTPVHNGNSVLTAGYPLDLYQYASVSSHSGSPYRAPCISRTNSDSVHRHQNQTGLTSVPGYQFSPPFRRKSLELGEQPLSPSKATSILPAKCLMSLGHSVDSETCEV